MINYAAAVAAHRNTHALIAGLGGFVLPQPNHVGDRPDSQHSAGPRAVHAGYHRQPPPPPPPTHTISTPKSNTTKTNWQGPVINYAAAVAAHRNTHALIAGLGGFVLPQPNHVGDRPDSQHSAGPRAVHAGYHRQPPPPPPPTHTISTPKSNTTKTNWQGPVINYAAAVAALGNTHALIAWLGGFVLPRPNHVGGRPDSQHSADLGQCMQVITGTCDRHQAQHPPTHPHIFHAYSCSSSRKRTVYAITLMQRR